jgi:hypothetical protein
MNRQSHAHLGRLTHHERSREARKAARALRPALFLTLGLLIVGGTELCAADAGRQPLPPPIIDPHSTEICMNSRISYHGGWSSSGTEQMLADVLHATAQAPVTGASRTIYAATSTNVYIYDPASHSLTVHKAGNWRSDNTAAFEVGIAADRIVDAGAAMHLGQLESIAIWTGTTSQLASCPRASAVTYANSNWNLPQPVDIVTSYGIRSVPGFTSTLVAISSDGSLPNPYTNGAVYMDSALVAMAYGTTFASEDLELSEISQLLWGAYGCSNHTATGKAGLVCASAVANYYLTRHIYSVEATAVHRFHNRLPPGTSLTTRDHRIELVQTGDARPALRQAVADLPEAPYYMIICTGQTGDWPELETGFAAVGAVLEATSMGLQSYETAGLSTQQQAAIRAATGIPTGDLPIVIVSLGRPIGGSGVEERDQDHNSLALSVERPAAFGGGVTLHYVLPAASVVDLVVHDCMGRQVRGLLTGTQASGAHSAFWDCTDDRRQPVPAGAYFCHLRAGGLAQGARVVVVR